MLPGLHEDLARAQVWGHCPRTAGGCQTIVFTLVWRPGGELRHKVSPGSWQRFFGHYPRAHKLVWGPGNNFWGAILAQLIT